MILHDMLAAADKYDNGSTQVLIANADTQEKVIKAREKSKHTNY